MDIIIGDQTLKLPAGAARELRGKGLRVAETPAGVLEQPEE